MVAMWTTVVTMLTTVMMTTTTMLKVMVEGAVYPIPWTQSKTASNIAPKMPLGAVVN